MSSSVVLNRSVCDDASDPEQLIRRARALVPMLRERAEEVERARMVPPETVEAFKEAGFFKILQPKRWGGYESDLSTFLHVLTELGRGCCSSAWVMMILGIHQWEFGLMDEAAGDDVWAQDSTKLVGSSYAPVSTLTAVDGGYILKAAKWFTSSGTDHADWAFLGGFLLDDLGNRIDRVSALVPRTEFYLEDDWHTFGLCGTGSKSLIIERDVFVPAHRVHSVIAYDHRGKSELYRSPFMNTFFIAVSAVVTGFAQGGIDVFIEQMKGRDSAGMSNNVGVSPYVKDRLGNAVANVRECKSKLNGVAQSLKKFAQANEEVTLSERVSMILDGARIGNICRESMLLIYQMQAARGIFLTNPIQRILRDVLVASNHVTQNADDNAGALGDFILSGKYPPFFYDRP